MIRIGCLAYGTAGVAVIAYLLYIAKAMCGTARHPNEEDKQ